MKYKTPVMITLLSQKIVVFWFLSASIILSFGFGDMLRIFRQVEMYYPGRPSTDSEVYSRYESLYFVDRMPRE